MRLNKTELKKILYDFNSYSNRLLQADFEDYLDVLGKFLKYIESTPIIMDYIKDCGECELDLAKEVEEVSGSYGREIFSTGDTEDEEVRNVYGTLKYIVENKINVPYGVAFGYSSSKHYQDKIKGFNERFVMVLIRYIEGYLSKVGIDMGLDDKKVYNVTFLDGLAIIATDHATVTATNQVGLSESDLERLVIAVRNAVEGLTPDEQETVTDSLEVIENEAKAEKPRKGLLKTAVKALQGIKGTVEFGAAVAAIVQFVTPLL